MLTDLHLPGESGFDLCRRIKAAPELRQIPVVLITGSGSPADVLVGLEAGADGFMTKGREPADIVRRIRRALTSGAQPAPLDDTQPVPVIFLGREFQLAATRQQLFNVLLSAFDDVVHLNDQLRRTNQKLKETQSQLVQSEKLASLGTLAAGMAHEINNPLAFITNNVSVLERDIADLFKLIAAFEEASSDLDQSKPEAAERIGRLKAQLDLPYIQQHLPRVYRATHDGLTRVAKIAQSLLSFGRLDHTESERINIHETLNQNLELVGESLERARITVERYYGELPLIECSAAQLNQVFLNLLMNSMQAIEATGKDSGQIRVTTRQSDGTVVVEITDNGCGIPPDVLPKIFDPFFTTKPVGQGTGLGLSICHGIVSEHGGRIEVESTPDEGSCVRVHLPMGTS